MEPTISNQRPSRPSLPSGPSFTPSLESIEWMEKKLLNRVPEGITAFSAEFREVVRLICELERKKLEVEHIDDMIDDFLE